MSNPPAISIAESQEVELRKSCQHACNSGRQLSYTVDAKLFVVNELCRLLMPSGEWVSVYL